ncbi:MAG: metallophosphoesterase [Candidatus Delongbacteria bacterium]|nr:metallophosphoesterase [Candidatus Delongbacteria bacterium]MBN2834617.1 metallophosphoesterase [Candidatus Delongbacteria bacterium]
MRTLIIGDIHGCSDELLELLEVFKPKAEDRIFSTGDVIGRGPDSKGVLELISKYRITTVLGNHEKWFIKNFKNNYDKVVSLNVDGYFSEISKWPIHIDDKNFILVHAGFNPNIGLVGTDDDTKVSVRTLKINGIEAPWFDYYTGTKRVIFGHWAKLGLYKNHNILCLDSGCVYGKFLTGYIFEEDSFIQIPAKKVYSPIINK